MSHVFRLSSGGADTLDGWSDSNQYNSRAISTIEDPSGGVATLPITSIPSPFASLELVRGAFSFCAENIDGDTIYHKMVSQTLDVIEIFFDYSKYQRFFDIITWDIEKDLQELIRSNNENHKCLGETLALYLRQDVKSFNFGKLSSVYLLDYRGGPAPLNIVGGTSSTSLCVASNNNLSYVGDVFLSNGHRAFDGERFMPLHKRSGEFFRYLWSMSLLQEFGQMYVEVKKYIEAAYRHLNDGELKTELKSMRQDDYQSAYMPLSVNAQTLYFPGGIVIGTKVGNDISASSDFRLASQRTFDTAPLVLPIGAYTEPGMRYTTGCWDSQFNVPFFDEYPIEKRTLPHDGSEYPYLTVSDFLEPYILQTPFAVNGSDFFNGGSKDASNYLLPLRHNALKYLTLDEIKGWTQEVRPRKIFEIIQLAGKSVKAILNVPVQKGKYITLERIYYSGVGNTSIEPDEKQNKGAVIHCTFDLFLFPSFHFADAKTFAPQRVYLVDEDTHAVTMDYNYVLKAYDADGAEVEMTKNNRADKHKGDLFSSKYFCSERQFDCLELSNGFANGMLLPNYRIIEAGDKAFEFAIDFGTTNTHIEYKIDGLIKPLEIGEEETQMLSLHNYADRSTQRKLYELDCQSFVEAVPEEFVPYALGKTQIASFPLRTNLCVPKLRNYRQQDLAALCDLSIGFHYEKSNTYTHNECITNLKWGASNAKFVEAYFEELLMLIRNKIILNGGNIDSTSIKWFYPVSMPRFQYSQLDSAWKNLCATLINPHCTPIGISESLAPYYYYKNAESVNSARRPAVSMDIGGGTTDFVVYRNNTPEIISSVRFAANAVYGDFIGSNMRRNGFACRYAALIKSIIVNCNSACRLFDEIQASENTADFVSFLYSLEQNPDLRREKINVSFSKILASDYEMKIVILLFFASEIYYIANVLKSRKIDVPGYITLSGTGSKILNLAGSFSELEIMARHIFSDVMGQESNVELRQVNQPKEITCKGGLSMTPNDFVPNPNTLKFFLTGSSILDAKSTKTLEEVDIKIEDEVVAKYTEFIEYFFSLDAKMPFADFFGIPSLHKFDDFKRILTDKAAEDLAAMLELRRRELSQQKVNELDDSLFFFPLAGGLNRLAYYISQENS